MQKFTEATHFIPGSHWAEQANGTNAIGLALTLQQPCTVFATEHYWPVCHDIVCYAAPIIHPQSGQLAGVLDLSTNWQRHTPLTETAVTHMANNIAQRLPLYLPRAELEIHALGQARVLFRGQRLHLSQRQLEIVCILALHPEGMTLEALHHALCGNASTNPSTIKTILTQLRHLLEGQIGSHPYRLGMSVWADFVELPRVLQENRMVYHRQLKIRFSYFDDPKIIGHQCA
jgi:transcriptional regulator of acetoin/glycerol metabolism